MSPPWISRPGCGMAPGRPVGTFTPRQGSWSPMTPPQTPSHSKGQATLFSGIKPSSAVLFATLPGNLSPDHTPFLLILGRLSSMGFAGVLQPRFRCSSTGIAFDQTTRIVFAYAYSGKSDVRWLPPFTMGTHTGKDWQRTEL